MTWGSKANTPTVMRHSRGFCDSSGNIFVAGGLDASQSGVLWKYNASADSWAAMASATLKRYGFVGGIDPATNLIYTAGGQGDAGAATALQVYDPSTNSWTAKAPIPANVVYGDGCFTNGLLYVIGGSTDTSATNGKQTVRTYNPSTNAWGTAANMPIGLSGHSAALGIDGKIYVYGGRTTAEETTRALYVFDPVANTWDSTRANAPVARSWPGLVGGADGCIYLVGGMDGSRVRQADSYRYDPAANAWSAIDSLPQPVSQQAMVIDKNGLMFSVAGFNASAVANVYTYQTTPPGPQWSYWDGAAEVPCAVSLWDGSAEVPCTTEIT